MTKKSNFFYRLTPKAREDLKEIGRYTSATWGKKQRTAYLKMLDRQFQKIAATPERGQARDEITDNLKSDKQGRHVIFYQVKEQVVIIVRILHEKMDVERHLVP